MPPLNSRATHASNSQARMCWGYSWWLVTCAAIDFGEPVRFNLSVPSTFARMERDARIKAIFRYC
jgi:hypothetical protein